MSFYLVKSKNGTYSPLDESDFEASKSIGVGTVVKATAPRNFKFHKKAFALLNLGFASQEKYKSFEVYRKIITIRAGYFEEVEGKDGHNYYFPKSLAFDAMSSTDFESWFNDTINTISSDTSTAPEALKNEIEGFY